jgi:uncharacterized protein YukJ
MAINYGALRGTFDRAKREDDRGSPHLQIRVLADDTPWRVTVNVESEDGSDVVYWVVNPITNHPILNAIAGLPVGFTAVRRDAAHALDFVKAPLFDFAAGLVLPSSGSANADDLQDVLLMHLHQLKSAGGNLIAFGARFGRNRHRPIDREFGNRSGRNGIHDVHLNQGNRRGSGHASDNGTFHDGGLLLAFPDRSVGLFLAFQSQAVPTDKNGDPVSGSRYIRDLLGRYVPPPAPLAPPVPSERVITIRPSTVYLERALINPAGGDLGRETVVLGNLATTTVDLTGWSLQDTTGRVSLLDGTIAAGASLIVELDGTGVQLGNRRGNLLLLGEQDQQVDAATYSTEDAKIEDRYVRF